ncbi:hypothetical protein DERP_008892 [Dermatophagoides pteronyssinus]|uniref:Uncharacterized protein n=1 Tax=Dermatophagoides pteronyssinus TaxID=6956 RepID=A0ABQ8JN55_DERPT|nr:hypothetical protein DERP_008892 [Dermatophagoides pteronyssinus]
MDQLIDQLKKILLRNLSVLYSELRWIIITLMKTIKLDYVLKQDKGENYFEKQQQQQRNPIPYNNCWCFFIGG